MIDPPSPARQVEVLLCKPFDHGFDYAVPAGMEVRAGDYVRVPFGRQMLVGVVWGEGRQDVPAGKVKPVAEVLSHLPPMQETMRRVIDWVSRYTLSPKGMVLKMALPVAEALELPKKRERVTVEGTAELRPIAPQLSEAQAQVAAELATRLDAGFSVSVLDGVTGSGKTEVYFDTIARALEHPVIPAQAGILTTVGEDSRLRGNDGGKGQVLVLLPEIALGVQWVERCEQRFGVTPHIWHSGLTPAKRRDTWRAVADGSARLVVGARSALFLPYRNLRLIIVDEEHEQSYKQEDGVLYQARDMAVARAHLEKLPVVLVSATPSMETVHNLRQGRYHAVHLPERHGGVHLPKVEMVDMRQETLESGTWISPALRTAIGETLASGRQAMLFLNRRGYAPLLLCRACGHRFACEACSSWMVVHGGKKRSESRVQSSVSPVIPAQAGIHNHGLWNMDSRLRGNDGRKAKGHNYTGRLQCHHCGHTAPIPEKCPGCAEVESLVACGPGVERVAEEVRAIFPQARVEMMTSDTMTGLATAEDTVQAMTRGEIDVLVGTQMMAKGYHFPKLHCIGVVDADLGLQGGDMRAGERTYQLLHQVAGRAGREKEQGRVLLQTYLPDHPVMQALAAHDRAALEELELDAREAALLPPYGRLASVIVEAEKETDAVQACRALAARIPQGEVRVLGPAPAPLARLRGRYRYRFLARAGRDVQLQPFLRGWVGQFDFPARIRVRVDVDPYSFL